MLSIRFKVRNDSSSKYKILIIRNTTYINLLDNSKIMYCYSACKNTASIYALLLTKICKSNEISCL